MRRYDTLSEAINGLKKDGYVNDFNLHPEWIECPPLNLRMKPQEFMVDQIHRFEGASNPDDNAVLFAISSDEGVKGLLVDAYGVYSESISPLMIAKLKVDYSSGTE
jgi:hypothetical protein